MRSSENSNSGPVTAALRRSSAVAGSSRDTRFTTSSMTRSGGRTGWRVARSRTRSSDSNCCARDVTKSGLPPDSVWISRARSRTGSAATAPSDSLTMATTSAASSPPSCTRCTEPPARSSRPSSAASSCSGTSSSRHVATSIPGKRGDAATRCRNTASVGRDAHCRSSSTSSTGPPSATSVSQPSTASYSGYGSPWSALACAWSEAKCALTSSGTSLESCAPWRARTMPTPAGDACAR